MKIVLTGDARAYDRESEEPIDAPERLAELDGRAFAEETCGEYLSESLYEIGVFGGQIELCYDADRAQLCVQTSYHAPRKLKKAELKELIAETTGQWSDGIGEGEFLFAEELGIEVDISASAREPEVEQFDDGVVVRKPRKSELVKLLEGRPVDEEAAIELVKRGAAIDARNRYGQSVLELACREVLPNLVELLLKRGALKQADEAGRALMRLAYCYGTDEVLEQSAAIARQLSEQGVDVDWRDDDGRTPLMMAANRSNLPLVTYMLSVGADINARQADEHNQLSVLMYAQSPEMVTFLLEQGADPNIPNASGENAYKVQLRNSHQQGYKQMAELMKPYLKQ